MPLRFRMSLKLGPGVRLNVGKKSLGMSVGTRGMRYSVNTSGRRTTSIGIPGTGLSNVTTSSARRSSSSTRGGAVAQPVSAPPGLPKPGLLAPGEEKRFYEGLQAFRRRDFQGALQAFEAAAEKDTRNVSDDLLAGVMAVKVQQKEKAIGYLENVVRSDVELPDKLMRKFLPPGGSARIIQEITITPRVKAEMELSSLSAALLLAELYQEAGRLEEAIGLIQQLGERAPSDPALKLSLCDLLYEDGDDDGVVAATGGVANDSDLELACLHLRAKALVRKGLVDAGLEVYTACLKRTSGRDKELLRQIRYDRAVLYQDAGRLARARKEFEKLYAEAHDYQDVADRLRTTTDSR